MNQIDKNQEQAHGKQHREYRNATLKQREDKRTKDRLYRAVTERYY